MHLNDPYRLALLILITIMLVAGLGYALFVNGSSRPSDRSAQRPDTSDMPSPVRAK
jgi:hypothetical protein